MEFKLRIKLALIIVLLFGGLICYDWYSNMDYVNIQRLETSNRIEDKDLIQLQGDYDVDLSKQYEWNSYKTIKYTKGNIPFTFNEEILDQTKRNLILYKP